MKKMTCLLLMIFLTKSNATDSIVLKKGEVAPYDGLLLTQEKATDTKNKLIEREDLLLINQSLNKSIELYKKNEDLYTIKVEKLTEQNTKLATSLYETREFTPLERAFYFGLGVVATSLAFYGAYQLAK